jgi:hypothetical protein
MRNYLRLLTSLCLIACVFPLVACGGQAISSTDQIATRVAQDLAVAATLTAVARAQPTAEPPQVATPEPSALPTSAPPEPTALPEPTEAPPEPTQAPPEPTDIPIPPTAPPEPTAPPIAYTDVNFNGDPKPGEEVGGKIQIVGTVPSDSVFPVVRSFLAIRVFARFPASAAHDGEGVDNVQIRIESDETGETVQDQTEHTAGYCSFGGGEPDCVVWVFAEHGNKWPKGQPITNGTYTVNVTITPVDQNNPTVNWNFQFEVAQS